MTYESGRDLERPITVMMMIIDMYGVLPYMKP
jgi:hypothetical protein